VFGANSNVIAATFLAKDQASKTVNGLRQNIAKLGGPRFGVLGNAVGGLSAMSLGAFGAAAGVGVLSGGIEAFGNVLGSSVRAAAEEQVNIARLGAALKANVKDWNGNTDAIEAQIQQRELLGFSDDDLRDSLSRLVIRTHDVEKAFQDQSLAMDIARGRGIDSRAQGDGH
jgi:hypothetical protein